MKAFGYFIPKNFILNQFYKMHPHEKEDMAITGLIIRYFNRYYFATRPVLYFRTIGIYCSVPFACGSGSYCRCRHQPNGRFLRLVRVRIHYDSVLSHAVLGNVCRRFIVRPEHGYYRLLFDGTALPSRPGPHSGNIQVHLKFAF